MNKKLYDGILQPCDILIEKNKRNFFDILFGRFSINLSTISIFMFDDLCISMNVSDVKSISVSEITSKMDFLVLRYKNIKQKEKHAIVDYAFKEAASKRNFIRGKVMNLHNSGIQFIVNCFYSGSIKLFPDKNLDDITVDDFLHCDLLEQINVNDCITHKK